MGTQTGSGFLMGPGVYKDANTEIPLTPDGQPMYATAGAGRLAALYHPDSAINKDFAPVNAEGRLAEYGAQQYGAKLRSAPTTDYGQADQARGLGLAARGSQEGALALFRGAANGTAPSVAQADYLRALQAQRQAQASGAASVRGGSLARAAAQARALDNSAQIGQGAAASMASLRAQEMDTARQGYANVAGQMRGQDLGLQGQDAGQAQFRTQSELANRGANDAMVRHWSEQASHVGDMQMAGGLAHYQATEDAIRDDNRQQGVNNQASQVSDARDDAYVSGVVGSLMGMGGMAAKSDRRFKTDIQPGDRQLSQFLDSIDAHAYRYKGEHEPKLGPMADELERTPIGKTLVAKDGAGMRYVDYQKSIPILMSGLASVHDRLSRMEAGGR